MAPSAASTPAEATPVPLLTVIDTAAEVAVLLDGPVATAVSEWTPLASVVVSRLIEYGLAVTGAPRFAPSTLNCMLETAEFAWRRQSRSYPRPLRWRWAK